MSLAAVAVRNQRKKQNNASAAATSPTKKPGAKFKVEKSHRFYNEGNSKAVAAAAAVAAGAVAASDVIRESRASLRTSNWSVEDLDEVNGSPKDPPKPPLSSFPLCETSSGLLQLFATFSIALSS